MRSKKRNKMTLLLALGLTVVTVGLLVGILIYSGLNQPVAVVQPQSSQISSEIIPLSSEEEIPQPSTVRIMGAGDDLIHEGIYQQAKKRAGGVGYDFAFAYENIADLVAIPDIMSINQETVLATEMEPSSYPMFNSPTQLGDHLIELGFDVFNQANNHTLDKGEKGLLSTLSYWKTKPQAIVTGVYEDQADYENIRLLTKNDITFSFIGMTEWTNGLSLPRDSDVILMRTQDEDEIKNRIEKAKEISDVVVVNVHWGVEYTHTPNEGQKSLAKKMVEWGADIIFGHHPHVIQPMEYIERMDGTKGIVCYSLGNFISAQEKGARMIGGIMDITVEKNHETEKIDIIEARFIPVVTHYGAGYSNIQVYPFAKYTDEMAKTHGVKARTPEFSYEYIENTVEQVIDQQFLTPYK